MNDMVKSIRCFMDFCYIVRRNAIDENALVELGHLLDEFHQLRDIFIETGVRSEDRGISLPRQHSLCHYIELTRLFGAPNGHCSSMTESKHIVVVKEPWRRSSRFEALGQMLLTNQRLDKLSRSRQFFEENGLLREDLIRNSKRKIKIDRRNALAHLDDENLIGKVELAHTICMFITFNSFNKTEVHIARGYSDRSLTTVGEMIGEPRISSLARVYLYEILYSGEDGSALDEDELPHISKLEIFNSAVAWYYAPSDRAGVFGMNKERIRCSPRAWRGGSPRYDCIVCESDPEQPGFRGLFAAQVRCFFRFKHLGMEYPCALVYWFTTVGDMPDALTGMWVVKPEMDPNDPERRHAGVIPIGSILRGVHLIPAFGNDSVPATVSPSNSLDCFKAFYVNKYADHHSHEILF